MRIFDVHAHVFPEAIAAKAVENLEQYYHMKWAGKGTLEDLEDSMRCAGVEQAVIFSTATKPEQVETINSYIGSLAKEPFIGFGTLHPDYGDYRREIGRIKELGLRGIKLHPDFQQFNIDDDRMLRIYEEVGDSLPFLIHMGDETSDYSAPRRLASVLDRLPGLTVIAAHMGGYSRWEEAKEYLAGREVYFDTSSTTCKLPYEKAAELVHLHGADRVLFGTDYPAVKHSEAIADFMKWGLSPQECEKILFSNAKRLFGL